MGGSPRRCALRAAKGVVGLAHHFAHIAGIRHRFVGGNVAIWQHGGLCIVGGVETGPERGNEDALGSVSKTCQVCKT